MPARATGVQPLNLAVGPMPVVTVHEINELVPAPKRREQTSWSNFPRSHWELLSATDFFTVEVWMMSGLVTYGVNAPGRLNI